MKTVKEIIQLELVEAQIEVDMKEDDFDTKVNIRMIFVCYLLNKFTNTTKKIDRDQLYEEFKVNLKKTHQQMIDLLS